jgi:hypothetical protein
MRLRYIGPADLVDLPLPGGCLQFARGEWVDVEQACTAALIPLHHLKVIGPALAEHPHWELATEAKPTAKSSKQKESQS